MYLYAAAQAVAGYLELTNVLLAKSAWALRTWLSASNLFKHVGNCFLLKFVMIIRLPSDTGRPLLFGIVNDRVSAGSPTRLIPSEA